MTLFKKTFLALAAAGALGACATVSNETRGTIVVEGVSYVTITRQFDQNGSTVLTGDVIYANRSYGCNTQQPGACEAVVRQLRNSDDVGRTVEGLSTNSFIISGMG